MTRFKGRNVTRQKRHLWHPYAQVQLSTHTGAHRCTPHMHTLKREKKKHKKSLEMSLQTLTQQPAVEEPLAESVLGPCASLH